jgi:cytochrome c-type biogenesis protein CcmH/NrfG
MRAKNCEPLYYLGLALRAQGKYTEAYDFFYRATWVSHNKRRILLKTLEQLSFAAHQN